MCHEGFSNVMSFLHLALDKDTLHFSSRDQRIVSNGRQLESELTSHSVVFQAIFMIRKNDYLRDKNPVCIPIGQTVSVVAEWLSKDAAEKMWLIDEKTAYLLHPFTRYTRQK